MSDKVKIFDTTLRDGEQSAGVAFTPEDKLEIARQLERLGVDVIEAGFPCTSKGDLHAVQLISREVRGASICALARAVARDIDIAWEGVREAEAPRLHVFINASDIQMAHQLRKGRREVLEQTEAMVRHAAGYTSDVEFSPMDATRSDPEFLHAIIERAIAAGATTINVPDSVGYALPEESAAMFAGIREHVPNIDEAVLSAHCHDDLGLAVANSLAAISAGVRQVEVAINGIGERAGNTSLEEVVMAIATRGQDLGVHTGVRTPELYRTAKLVERLSGMDIQPNKAIVGRNAFRHGSGIHQDGILKLRQTWEIMDPADIGVPGGTQLVMGKLSGRHAFREHLRGLGHALEGDKLDRAFTAFKALADRKVTVDDRDLEAIAAEHGQTAGHSAWTVDRVQISSGCSATPTATLRLRDEDGQLREDAATGSGPLDAVYRAVNRITGVEPTLADFSIRSVTEGRDAQGEVTVHVEASGRSFAGRAADTDIIVAGARAYTAALNRLVVAGRQKGASA